MIGDSITDCGRARPEGKYPHLGSGYVNIVNGFIQALHPEKNITITNKGIGGNTVLHLRERWQEDVYDLKPDWLSIKIGINDVWRQFDSPHLESYVTPDIFEENYRYILEGCIKNLDLKGLIILSPFYLMKDKNDKMRIMMDQYGAIVKKLAAEFNAPFIDVQKGYDAMMESIDPVEIAADRIHPDFPGHAMIAGLFLKEIGAI